MVSEQRGRLQPNVDAIKTAHPPKAETRLKPPSRTGFQTQPEGLSIRVRTGDGLITINPLLLKIHTFPLMELDYDTVRPRCVTRQSVMGG